MSITEIVNNKTKKGNEILTELGEVMPEYKDYRLGSKGMYTPNDVVRSLETLQHYATFGDDLWSGTPKTQ